MSTRPFQWLIGSAMITGMVTPLYVESELPGYGRLLASLLWAMCLWPSWRYLRQPPVSRAPIPFLPFVGIFYGFYCAMPMLLGASNLHWRIRSILPTDYVEPLELILAGWCLLLLSYSLGTMLWHQKRRVTALDLTPSRASSLGVILLCGGVVADLLFHSYAYGMPKALVAPLRFLAVLNWAGVGLLTISWKRGWLSRSRKLILCAGVIASALVQLGSGSASNLVWVVVILLFSIWIAGGGLPMRWLVLALVIGALVIITKGVTDRFRQVAWWNSTSLSGTARAQVMVRLISDAIVTEGVGGALGTGTQALVQRSAMMDMFADVVRRTPSEVPYWYGDSYISLPAVLIPRVFWPSKPEKNLGQRFGHRYGYSSTFDKHTSVNLAYVVEFYINFGAAGVMLGMLLVGVLFAGLESAVNRPGQPIQVSVCALVLLQPLFNIESDFSLIFGGVFTTGVALLLLSVFMKRENLLPMAVATRPAVRPLAARRAGPA